MNMYNPQINSGTSPDIVGARPSKAEAEAAARTLLLWAGDEPSGIGAADLTAILARTGDAAYPAFNRSYPRGFAADAAYRRDAARPAERPREPDQGRQDRHPARRHLQLPPAGPLPHPRGRRGPARDLGHRLGLAGGEQEGHQHEPHHAVLLQARRDLLLLRGDRRGARQLPRRSRQLRRPHHDAAQLPDAEALAPQRPRRLPVLQRRARDDEDRGGDPPHRASRLRLFLDLPLLARALRARPPHPQPDRHAALAALGRPRLGRARRHPRCSGSRTSSTSATPPSPPRPR